MLQTLFGKRGVKVNSDEADGHKDGTPCIVIAESVQSSMGFVYLTLFEDFPLPVATTDYKVKVLSNNKTTKMRLTKQHAEYLDRFPKKMFRYYDEEGQIETTKS